MSVTLHLHDEFKRQFRRLKKKYQSLTDDLEDFQKELIKNPLQGSDLGGGVRKEVITGCNGIKGIRKCPNFLWTICISLHFFVCLPTKHK